MSGNPGTGPGSTKAGKPGHMGALLLGTARREPGGPGHGCVARAGAIFGSGRSRRETSATSPNAGEMFGVLVEKTGAQRADEGCIMMNQVNVPLTFSEETCPACTCELSFLLIRMRKLPTKHVTIFYLFIFNSSDSVRILLCQTLPDISPNSYPSLEQPFCKARACCSKPQVLHTVPVPGGQRDAPGPMRPQNSGRRVQEDAAGLWGGRWEQPQTQTFGQFPPFLAAPNLVQQISETLAPCWAGKAGKRPSFLPLSQALRELRHSNSVQRAAVRLFPRNSSQNFTCTRTELTPGCPAAVPREGDEGQRGRGAASPRGPSIRPQQRFSMGI